MPQDAFRKAEGYLYSYRENVARLETLRATLRELGAASSAKAQQYDTPPSAGVADPVAERLERIERVELDILLLERWTKPIERLIEDLSSPLVLDGSINAELRGILELRYLGGNTWERTADELNMGRSTYWRKRQILVEKAVRYLGL